MKKALLLIFALVCALAAAACSGESGAPDAYIAEPPAATPEPTPEESVKPSSGTAPVESTKPEPSAGPVETVKIYTPGMWNEFARSYNSEREKYAGFVTVEITLALDFKDTVFVPLADGFSGKITAVDELSAEEMQEQRRESIKTRKIWPQDYSGTFMNISSLEEVNGEAASSLFGDVGELVLENVSFAIIYLDGAECLLAGSADTLKLSNVSVQNCMLPDAHAIAAVNAGSVSVECFTAESCVLTGYEHMAGLVERVEGDAEFKDVFICRSSFILSPDNGGSGLWNAGIGILAKTVGGDASFENIDLYGCSTTALYTSALTGSAGSVSECSNVSLDFCSFMNYRPMGSSFSSGLISSCGGAGFMEMAVFEENISITNSNIGGEYVEEDFAARGYHVENCIFTPGKEEPPQ